MYVDIHAHLDHSKFFGDLDKVIERCRKEKVIVITSGVNTGTNRKALEIAEKYSDVVRVSLGLYPIDALAVEMKSGEFPRTIEVVDVDKELEFIKKNKNKIIAIGEAGLDLAHIGKIEEQKKTFLKVIELAEKIKKPLIVHSRKAEREAVEVLESSKLKKVVMHCFCGRLNLVKKIEDNGWMLSIPPIIFKSQQFQLIAERVNVNQLLTETDAPYLAPPGEDRNEPIFVKKTVEKIAEIKKMDKEEVKKNIFMNYQKMFLE